MEDINDETIKEAELIFINERLVYGAEKLRVHARKGEERTYSIARLTVPDEQVAVLLRRIVLLKE